MAKTAIFICDGLSFMTNAIVESLTKADYEIIPVKFNETELEVESRKSDLIIFYLGDYVEGEKNAFAKLKALCEDEGKVLVLIGNEEEFVYVKSHVSNEYIAASFTRPLDMKAMIAGLSVVMSDQGRVIRAKSILLVDDDKFFLKMVHSWLSEKYRVTTVESGMQAITYLANHTPDLILLDYEMPVTDGPQVLEMIRSEKNTKDTPVVFLTGKGDRESVEKVLSLGPDGYLLKSIGKIQLLEKVSEFFKKFEDRH